MDNEFRSIVRPRGQFLRSIQLELDFKNSSIIKSLIATEKIQENLAALAAGLEKGSGRRAWRVVGDYGTGKSAFALLASHWFAGNIQNFNEQSQKKLVYEKHGLRERPNLFPLLITGDQQPLSELIQIAIVDAINQFRKQDIDITPIKKLLTKKKFSNRETIELLIKFNNIIITSNIGNGLFLVIDEMGKLLEYTAKNPDSSDVYLWQLLGELASRSSDETIYVLCLLHQGFSSYTQKLDLESDRQEWNKVAGRFSELVFRQPLEQAVEILAAAMNVDIEAIPKEHLEQAKLAMEAAAKCGWYGVSANSKKLIEIAPQLYPLHPFVIPVLDRLLRKYGQNTRSFYAFLFGSEPYSLQNHLKKSQPSFFRVENLLDYTFANFGHVLSSSRGAASWFAVKGVIDAFHVNNQQQLSILKTIGMLNLLDSSDLLPNKETVSWSIQDCEAEASTLNGLEQLQAESGRRAVYDKGAAGGLCLWAHTSVDLHSAYSEAEKQVQNTGDTIAYLKSIGCETPLVSRKHYIRTGTLRFFTVKYFDTISFEQEYSSSIIDDGELVVLLPKSVKDSSRAEALAVLATKGNDRVVVVPRYFSSDLDRFIRRLKVTEHVFLNTPQLNGDPYAREAVSRRQNHELRLIQTELKKITGLTQGASHSESQIFYDGEIQSIKNNRGFSDFLAEILDNRYCQAPQIKNELLNRDQLSSSAAAARMRLLEAMFKCEKLPFLGMDSSKTPPEMAIYKNIFQNGNLHIKISDGCYALQIPSGCDDKLQIRYSIRAIDEILIGAQNQRVNVLKIINELRSYPYGVRNGIVFLLLGLYLITQEKKVALYEDSRYTGEVSDATMQRLTKRPETFELQFCKVEGVQKEVYEYFATAIVVSPMGHGKLDVLDIVKPLCVFAASLPEYVKRTNKISENAKKVRQCLFSAREPISLLFDDLPRACGYQKITSSMVIESDHLSKMTEILKGANNELQQAYGDLQNRLLLHIQECFGCVDDENWQPTVISRASHLKELVSEPKLKAFCLRAADRKLSLLKWVESIASLLVSKPPEKWIDRDELLFEEKMAEYSSRFIRTEAAVFTDNTSSAQSYVRLCLTKTDGNERKRVIADDLDEESAIALQKQLEGFVEKNGQKSLIAISNFLWKNLEGPNR